MLSVIKNRDMILAIIIKHDYKGEGIEFFTPEHFSQQLGYMNRPSGYKITPHVHNAVDREVKLTQEVLFIKSGRVRIDFFNYERAYLESTILQQGDVVLLADGGHGFEMLEDSEIIEVKQGPYSGDEDKTRFEPETFAQRKYRV